MLDAKGCRELLVCMAVKRVRGNSKGRSGLTQRQHLIFSVRLPHFRMWTDGDEEKERERWRMVNG